MEVSVGEMHVTAVRSDEYDDVLALLLDHRSRHSDEEESLAREIAGACMGDLHLWQDLGLPDRQCLSDMLEENFNPLFVKNSGNMKWKKFFYKQLCERMEVHACRAPSCAQCSDYDNCFGPEAPGARPM